MKLKEIEIAELIPLKNGTFYKIKIRTKRIQNNERKKRRI